MDRVLISGGAGFIGSHICDHFIKNGFEVLCVDNLITGRERNIGHLFDNKAFTFLKADICEPLSIKGPIKYIMHLASIASPIEYLKNPIETLRVGSVGTERMLNLALEKKARILMFSTSEVYGDPKEHPQKETYWGNVNPIGQRSCYDESKRFSEALVMAYQRKYNLETRIVRIFNTYGPRMRYDDGRIIPTVLRQIVLNEDITVFGSGEQTRSFCYVSDLVEGLILLLKSDYKAPVNLGNDKEFKIIDFVNIAKEFTESKCKVVHLPLPEDDPKVRKPDITLAKKLLGWEPKIDLKAGLAETLKYIKYDLTL